MTDPGEKGLGVLLADSVQQVARPVSRELLSLPIPFSRKRGGGERAVAWAQPGSEVACQEVYELARLGDRWGA